MANELLTPFQIFQSVHQEHQTTVDRVLKTFADGLDHYHKMLVLVAGMAGFVVPLLASQRTFVNTVVLRHATIWLCAAIFVGVVEVAVGRWLFVYELRVMYAEFRRQTQLLGAAGGDQHKLTQAGIDIEAGAVPFQHKLARVTALAALGDILFYGAILGGIIEIARAVMKG
jgi:hypothetical protein